MDSYLRENISLFLFCVLISASPTEISNTLDSFWSLCLLSLLDIWDSKLGEARGRDDTYLVPTRTDGWVVKVLKCFWTSC